MIVAGVTVAFRRGVLEHILNSRPKCALFTKAAALDANTQRYSPENEVQGGGYAKVAAEKMDILTGDVSATGILNPTEVEIMLMYRAVRRNRRLQS
jgi:hypothetical protein